MSCVDRIYMSFRMILKMLVRRRIVIVMFFVIPAVFLSVVALTISDRILPFGIASLQNNPFVEVSEKEISLLFFANAVTGFLASFLALNLIQKNNDENRRLIICGYHPLELLLSNFLSLFIAIFIIAVYVGILTSVFFSIKHLYLLILGLSLMGFVYGSYGLLVGSIIKGELEGVLLIVLLVNIDAGWIQNPLFYSEAQNQQIIKFLPAYFPSQSCIISAFTDYSVQNVAINSILYGLCFFVISMFIFFYKMKRKT